MAAKFEADERLVYRIPARTISGSAQEVLDQLDELMIALQLVRDGVASSVASTARWPRPGWLARAWRAVGSPVSGPRRRNGTRPMAR